MSVDNLKKILDAAAPYDVEAGIDSYRKYHRIMVKLANHCKTTPTIACAVFAALSPNNDYYGNLRDANKLLCAARDKKSLSDFTVSTYGQNKRKAWWIAHGADPLLHIVAYKTRNFFMNITDPEDRKPVTIDGHMLNVWRGKRENLVGIHFPPKLYEVVADGVRSVAAERDMVPCQVQAIIWLAWRRLHGIQSTHQLEMWDAELLAARLGYVKSGGG